MLRRDGAATTFHSSVRASPKKPGSSASQREPAHRGLSPADRKFLHRGRRHAEFADPLGPLLFASEYPSGSTTAGADLRTVWHERRQQQQHELRSSVPSAPPSPPGTVRRSVHPKTQVDGGAAGRSCGTIRRRPGNQAPATFPGGGPGRKELPRPGHEAEVPAKAQPAARLLGPEEHADRLRPRGGSPVRELLQHALLPGGGPGPSGHCEGGCEPFRLRSRAALPPANGEGSVTACSSAWETPSSGNRGLRRVDGAGAPGPEFSPRAAARNHAAARMPLLYFRPGEMTSLPWRQAAPPIAAGGAETQDWSMALHPLEVGVASKVGAFGTTRFSSTPRTTASWLPCSRPCAPPILRSWTSRSAGPAPAS